MQTENIFDAGTGEKLKLQIPILTFKNDKFYLLSSNSNTVTNSYWQVSDEAPYIFSTTNLKAAAVFRRYADDIAEKVFDRAFVKFYPLPDRPLPTWLDPHQIEGIKWALTRSRSYLAHAPGAGKTAEAIIASCYAEGEGTTVFIVPPGLTHNWQREIEKFIGGFSIWPSISVVGKSQDKDDVYWGSEFIIVPDSMLTKSWVLDNLYKLKIKFLGVDEASRFKEQNAKRSAVLYNGLFQTAKYTVFLDGSPMPNRPSELWAPTYALNPEAIDCMEFQDFGFRYCGATRNDRGEWQFNHSSNESELRKKLQKDFMHVVTEDQLSHPERRRSMLFMSKDVRSSDQRTWERRNIRHLTDSAIDAIGDNHDDRGEIAFYRRELGLRKVNWIAQYVSERLQDKNESILLYVWHREVAEKLRISLRKYNPGLVIGGTPNEEREKIFKKYQAKKINLIIGNISAMGRGHNLQQTDRAIFGEFSWSNETNLQAEKRASRRGSEKDFVRCEYIVCPNSMDERVLKSIFSKENRVARIIG